LLAAIPRRGLKYKPDPNSIGRESKTDDASKDILEVFIPSGKAAAFDERRDAVDRAGDTLCPPLTVAGGLDFSVGSHEEPFFGTAGRLL
jgi:hypothetical protein